MTPDVDKRYIFTGDDWDILVSIDGSEPQYIGSAATRPQAERKAADYVIDYYATAHTPEMVARLVMAGIPEGTDADDFSDVDGEGRAGNALTLPQTIALALTGTPDPVCELCGAPVFVSCGGHLYCKPQWQQGACNTRCRCAWSGRAVA